MIKLEFKHHGVNTSWEEWTPFIFEYGTIKKQVESKIKADAGLIVFDDFDLTLIYKEGNRVYQKFNTSSVSLTPDTFYLFRISIKQKNGTYRPVFEGMADFTSLWYDELNPILQFSVKDKLSSLTLIRNKPMRELRNLAEANLPALPSINTAEGVRYEVHIAAPEDNRLRIILSTESLELGGQIIPIGIIPQTTPFLKAGEILCKGDLNEEGKLTNKKYAFLKNEIPQSNSMDHDIIGDTNDWNGAIFYTTDFIDVYHKDDSNVKLFFMKEHVYGTSVTNKNEYSPGYYEVVSFDAIKIIQAIAGQAWGSIQFVNRLGISSSPIPLQLYDQLMENLPLGKEPYDAFKDLVESMSCYMSFNSEGKLVLTKKTDLLNQGNTYTINEDMVVERDRSYIWNDVYDAIEITMKRTIIDENGNSDPVEASAEIKRFDEEGYKPKNTLKKNIEEISTVPITKAELEDEAEAIALEFKELYMKRHEGLFRKVKMYDELLGIELCDNINNEYIVEEIVYDLNSYTVSLNTFSSEGYNY